MSGDYQLVQLANGAKTLLSTSYGEKMHPGLGPSAEAELLYVRQLEIPKRLQNHPGEFVVWDVGLGAAANAAALLRATRDFTGELRLVSFDNTTEPLEFALQNAAALGYVAGYEAPIGELLRVRQVKFQNGRLVVTWKFYLGDFPAIISGSSRREEAQITKAKNQLEPPRVGCYKLPPPHAIFFDAFSPAKNPAMWTLPVFENLFRAIDPARPCALTTYSRSTMIRASLLLAGFFVGVGHATGTKDETTIAANSRELIAEPLDARWLARAQRSDSAEPLYEPGYRRSPISTETLGKLRRHQQFQP